MNPVRVLLVDQQELVTSSLRTVLDLYEDIVVVGEAATQRECIEKVVSRRPHVVVMELLLREGSGLEAIKEIASRDLGARVLVLTSDDDDSSCSAAIHAGASGYLLKHARGHDVAWGIRLTAEGRGVIDPSMAAGLLRIREVDGQDLLGELTEREHCVLACVASGKTNLEIAVELHFSERTIKNVVSRAMTKIGARRRSEAAALFVRHGGRGSLGSVAGREPMEPAVSR
jgi:DNA-binding NarL/FixJ family response regulator